MQLGTERLILRPFETRDMTALFELLRDEEVNTFLPWFPVRSLDETVAFYEQRFKNSEYAFAICLKPDDAPIGYIKADTDESRDMGYALARRFWRCGHAREAGAALIERLRRDGVPYVTATHDRNNPRSGHVMRALGMRYCYSYEEQWQPKDYPVVFRLYQLNLDGRARVYRAYWEQSENRFIESDL